MHPRDDCFAVLLIVFLVAIKCILHHHHCEICVDQIVKWPLRSTEQKQGSNSREGAISFSWRSRLEWFYECCHIVSGSGFLTITSATEREEERNYEREGEQLKWRSWKSNATITCQLSPAQTHWHRDQWTILAGVPAPQEGRTPQTSEEVLPLLFFFLKLSLSLNLQFTNT